MNSKNDPAPFPALIHFMHDRPDQVVKSDQRTLEHALLTRLYEKTELASGDALAAACNRLLDLLTSMEPKFADFRRRMRVILDGSGDSVGRVFSILVDQAAGDAKTEREANEKGASADPAINRVQRQVEKKLADLVKGGEFIRWTELAHSKKRGQRTFRNYYALLESGREAKNTVPAVEELLPLLPNIQITAGMHETKSNEPLLFAYAEVLPGFLRQCLAEAGAPLSTEELKELVVLKLVPPLVRGMQSLEQMRYVAPQETMVRREDRDRDVLTGRTADDALHTSERGTTRHRKDYARRLLAAALERSDPADRELLEAWWEHAQSGLSIRAAAREMNVPHTTLDYTIKKLYKLASALKRSGEVEE